MMELISSREKAPFIAPEEKKLRKAGFEEEESQGFGGRSSAASS